MQNKKRYSPAVIQKLLDKGMTISAVAGELGCSYVTVRKYINRYGIDISMGIPML